MTCFKSDGIGYAQSSGISMLLSVSNISILSKQGILIRHALRKGPIYCNDARTFKCVTCFTFLDPAHLSSNSQSLTLPNPIVILLKSFLLKMVRSRQSKMQDKSLRISGQQVKLGPFGLIHSRDSLIRESKVSQVCSVSELKFTNLFSTSKYATLSCCLYDAIQ
ncbi:hypothetical protein FGO68_gene153 [Halteria grandinella]|uniref:Uncharacterized protein n=1 Tax=Halteria grandinella TaxID=5974 RepID=A0A8J8NXJ2_HALGN|nr:hypothetical protein FGO68_gene153 [Halteria grandinella]